MTIAIISLLGWHPMKLSMVENANHLCVGLRLVREDCLVEKNVDHSK